MKAAAVALCRCRRYKRGELKENFETMLQALGKRALRGQRVVLKPNLVSAGGRQGLTVTHPEVIAALAEWFLDHGCLVAVGDSPAVGSAKKVMDAHAITDALQGLPVRQLSFVRKRELLTAHGLRLTCAAEAFECDLLVNLPKLKAHGQMFLSLAVKNCFGVVLGWRKPLLHMRHGGHGGEAFVRMLVDVMELLPAGLSILDGVVAMHRRGPISGEPIEAGVLAASWNPVALDTTVLHLLGFAPERSPVWCETARRGMVGARLAECTFPLCRPQDFAIKGFQAPAALEPVRFEFTSFMVNNFKRIVSFIS